MSSWHPKRYARLAASGATNPAGRNKNRGIHRTLEAASLDSAYSVLRIKELIKRRLHVLNHSMLCSLIHSMHRQQFFPGTGHFYSPYNGITSSGILCLGGDSLLIMSIFNKYYAPRSRARRLAQTHLHLLSCDDDHS